MQCTVRIFRCAQRIAYRFYEDYRMRYTIRVMFFIYIYIYTSFYYLLIKVLKLRVRFVFVGPTLLVSRTEVSRLDVHFCWSVDCVHFMAGAGEIGSNTQNQQRSTGSFITIHLDIRGECR